MDATLLLQLAVSGLTVGSVYAVVALGLVVVYKATDVVNFAQGEFVMLGAYVGLLLHVSLGLPYFLAFGAALAVTALAGLVTERCAIRPLFNSPEFTVIMATFAIAIVIKGILRLIWRDYTFAFPPIASTQPLVFGGVRQSAQNLAIVGLGLAMMAALFVLFQKTKLGMAMRATAINRDAAWLMGVNVRRIFAISWALSGALGAAAGLMIAPLIGVHPEMSNVMIKAFVAALLGGFTSLPGAIAGGLVLGVFETVAGGFVPHYFKEILTFSVMMAVVVFLPQGFLGKAPPRKV